MNSSSKSLLPVLSFLKFSARGDDIVGELMSTVQRDRPVSQLSVDGMLSSKSPNDSDSLSSGAHNRVGQLEVIVFAKNTCKCVSKCVCLCQYLE